MRRLTFVSLSGALLAAAGFGTVALASASCSTHQCDGSDVELNDRDVDGGIPNGHLDVAQNTWESNPIDTPWFDLGPQKRIKFDVSNWGSREILSTEPYLSVDSDPVNNGSNWVLGSGNVAEIEQVRGNDTLFIQVHNDTCGQYFLRLVVRGSAPPRPAQPDAGDAGITDGEAGVEGGLSDAEAGITDAADAE